MILSPRVKSISYCCLEKFSPHFDMFSRQQHYSEGILTDPKQILSGQMTPFLGGTKSRYRESVLFVGVAFDTLNFRNNTLTKILETYYHYD